jgi:hypothetical protein
VDGQYISGSPKAKQSVTTETKDSIEAFSLLGTYLLDKEWFKKVEGRCFYHVQLTIAPQFLGELEKWKKEHGVRT